MWVKICGNTNLADAQLAAELGADALGFIFAPSPRQVTAEQVAAITRQLPSTIESIEKIGVFTTTAPETIVLTARQAGLTGVQLHGSFDPSLAPAVRNLSVGALTVLPVLRWRLPLSPEPLQSLQADALTPARPPEILSQIAHLAQQSPSSTGRIRVLIDAEIDGTSGGLGRPFTWQSAASALAEAPHLQFDLVVAGGLRPENVGAAIQALHPFGVDVASGVESGPGRKDPARLRDFLQAARATV